MELVKIIEGFREHKSNIEPALIQLNQIGNIYGTNQLADDDNTLLSLLGIKLSKEQIIGWGNYPINFVEYLRNTEIPSISQNAKQQMIQSIGDLLSGKIKSFEIHPDKSGTMPIDSDEKEIHLHFYGMRDSVSGNYSILIADQTDVTYFKRMYEVANKQLTRLADLGEVISEIVHDMRGPLISIGGWAKKLKKDAEKNVFKTVQSASDIIDKEATRLGDMLNEELDYARKPRLNYMPLNLNSLVNEVYKEEFELTKQPSITLELGEKVIVNGDYSKLGQVFHNLLRNAVEKGTATNVFLRTYVKGENSVIEVEDNGEPIPPDAKEKIFKPFFTRKYKGTGLGLSICYKIIDCHNGKIEVASEPGKTVFSVYLPLKISQA